MTLLAVLLAIALLCASALLALLCGRSDGEALAAGTTGGVAACALGLSAALSCLGGSGEFVYRAAWRPPLGEFHVALDTLSAFFLLCLFLVAGFRLVYGSGYLGAAHHGPRRPAAAAAAWMNLLIASIAALLIARDAVLFLAAWEFMSVASFFLVTHEDHRADVRSAGLTYLIASHLGAVFLFLMFGTLAARAGSFDFDAFSAAGPPPAASVCFLLALAGFGVKAGLWPLHIWLPEAHPAAPSHVSGLMSGVMIKTGLYGILRALTWLGPPQPWWGTLLIAVGAVSALAGALNALAQSDLKRMLAYSSAENVGIIAIGIGIGVLGRSLGAPAVAYLGFAGALLHTLNHGLFKSLLFHCAGNVVLGTGTREMGVLGGLGRRMPATSMCFLAGAVAACALPGMNGFASEWLVYMSALKGCMSLPAGWAVACAGAIPMLALAGGVAAACFSRAFGLVFLGEPRGEAGSTAREPSRAMLGCTALAAALCVALGFFPQAAMAVVSPAALAAAGTAAPPVAAGWPLALLGRLALALVVLIAAVAALRALLLRGRDVRRQVTWGCGYEAPAPRMQYSPASFAEPLLTSFTPLMAPRLRGSGPEDVFPARASYSSELLDFARERLLGPAFLRVIGVMRDARVLQHGRLQVYLLYILVTLMTLLLWQLGPEHEPAASPRRAAEPAARSLR